MTNNLCPKCGKTVHLYLNDDYMLKGDFKKEHLSVGWLNPDGTIILYHPVCPN